MTAADLIEPTTMRMVPATLDQGMGFDFTKVTRKEWNEIQELLMEKQPLWKMLIQSAFPPLPVLKGRRNTLSKNKNLLTHLQI